MSLVGYPDFQEQAQWQSPPVIVYAQNQAAGNTLTFPLTGPAYYNVNNWQSTQISVTASPQIIDVEMYWVDAVVPTVLLGQFFFTTAPGNRSLLTVPNAGPYLQVKVANRGVVGTAPTVVAMAFTNRVSAPFMGYGSGPLLEIGAQSVAAHATYTKTSDWTYAGPATFWGYTDSNEGWTYDIDAHTSDGTSVIVAQSDSNESTAADVQRRFDFLIPARPLFLVISNKGANPHNFWVSIYPTTLR